MCSFLMLALVFFFFFKWTAVNGNSPPIAKHGANDPALPLSASQTLTQKHHISAVTHTWKRNRTPVNWTHCNVLQRTKVYDACTIDNVSASSSFGYFYGKSCHFQIVSNKCIFVHQCTRCPRCDVIGEAKGAGVDNAPAEISINPTACEREKRSAPSRFSFDQKDLFLV